MDWTKRLNQVAVRLPLAGSIEILNWAYEPHLSDNVPHRHTYFEVCQIGAHGRGEFRVAGQPHPISSGDLFIARPGVVHQIVNTVRPKIELSWVCFSWMPERSSGESLQLLRAFADSDVLVARDENRCVASIWQALRVISAVDVAIGQEQQILALSSALLLAIAQSGAEVQPSLSFTSENNDGSRLTKLATRYIHDNLNRRLTVEEIAQQVHLSPRHLTRLMQQFTGVAPAAYIERARMDRARALLLHSSTQLKEIAREVGYADVHHFTRVCTRVWGQSPGVLRAQGENANGENAADVLNRQKVGALV